MRLSPILFSFLLLTPALTITVNKAHAALTATTANTIQGTAPYIELNGVKATNLNSLLSIKIGNDTYISDNLGAMKKVNGDGTFTSVTSITLANTGDTFNSVKTIIPPDTTIYALNNTAIIPLTARKDADGDGGGGGGFTITGDIKGEWLDKHNHSIGNNLTQSPTICNAPYTLTLTTDTASTNNPTISTQYGVPNKTIYGKDTAIFTINPVSGARICYAKPFSMHFGTGQYDPNDASIWDGGTTGGMGKGFLTQSTYSQNFPTTGANGLYFDLDIAGVSTALDWPVVTVGTSSNVITATMTNITNSSVRVTLMGPKASTTTVGATAPLPPLLPVTFELVGKDGGGTPVVKYGFAIKKWYINRGWQYDNATNQASWCSGLAGVGKYVLAKVVNLTNASGTAIGNGSTIPSVTINLSSYNNYQRRIGGGLFSEWGFMNLYTSADFANDVYWTSDTTGSYQFNVYSGEGYVGSYNPSNTNHGVCTQP